MLKAMSDDEAACAAVSDSEGTANLPRQVGEFESSCFLSILDTVAQKCLKVTTLETQVTMRKVQQKQHQLMMLSPHQMPSSVRYVEQPTLQQCWETGMCWWQEVPLACSCSVLQLHFTDLDRLQAGIVSKATGTKLV